MPPKKTKPKSLTIYSDILSNLLKLNDLGVLPNERLREAEDFLALDKFSPAKLHDGRELKDLIVHDPSLTTWNKDILGDNHFHYLRAELLGKHFFTEDEIDRLNKYAGPLWREKCEKNRFEKARKLKEDEYGGPVYDGDSYYSNVEEFRYGFEGNSEEGDELPEYLWTCEVKPMVNISLGDILERVGEDIEDFDISSLRGAKELKAAIEAFNEANKDRESWYHKSDEVVMLDKKP